MCLRVCLCVMQLEKANMQSYGGDCIALLGDSDHSDNKEGSCIDWWSVCEGPLAVHEHVRVYLKLSVCEHMQTHKHIEHLYTHTTRGFLHLLK